VGLTWDSAGDLRITSYLGMKTQGTPEPAADRRPTLKPTKTQRVFAQLVLDRFPMLSEHELFHMALDSGFQHIVAILLHSPANDPKE
jgi:hypothetical protein